MSDVLTCAVENAGSASRYIYSYDAVDDRMRLGIPLPGGALRYSFTAPQIQTVAASVKALLRFVSAQFGAELGYLTAWTCAPNLGSSAMAIRLRTRRLEQSGWCLVPGGGITVAIKLEDQSQEDELIARFLEKNYVVVFGRDLKRLCADENMQKVVVSIARAGYAAPAPDGIEFLVRHGAGLAYIQHDDSVRPGVIVLSPITLDCGSMNLVGVEVRQRALSEGLDTVWSL
jgi:hypothetical protein